jgi:ribose transport system ATP-binding protein
LADRDLTKSFLGQVALDSAWLTVKRGEVRALIGHNGSGKSTLIKILAGVYHPDSGSATVDGNPLPFGDPDASSRSGMRFIHQDLGLVDGLDVLENLKLGAGAGAYQTGFGWRIHWRRERRAARELLWRFDLDVEPDTPVGELSPVERTKLAVARAVQDTENASVLVLDEPTASLPAGEVEQLFGIVRGVIDQGMGVLYVSHRLEELYELCDSITVLRDGKVVGEAESEMIDRDRLTTLIIGAEAEEVEPEEAQIAEEAPEPTGEPLLAISDLAGANLASLNLEVRPGEVVGLAGLAGSGVNDLVKLLLGREKVGGGKVVALGTELKSLTPTALQQVGVAALPSQKALKSIQTMSVRENLTLPDLRPMWRHGIFRNGIDRKIAAGLVKDFDVRPAETERPLATLSGGNQQKVCVARWMRTDPKVFVLDEPTAGVDVGGRAQILEFLREAGRRGTGLVICSSDLDDLTEVCTRVVVIRGGRTATELRGKEVTRERIAAECYRSSDGA